MTPVAWLAAHKAAAAAAAAAAALGVVAAKRKSTAGGAATVASATPVSTAAPVGNSVYDSTAQDLYGSIQPQLAFLQSQIAAQAGQGPAAAPAVAAPGSAGYGQTAWNIDSAYAASQGITPLAAPADFGAYGQARYNQGLFAANHTATPDAMLPGATQGGGQTVAQLLAEHTALTSGQLGQFPGYMG